jgi:hypothetical protein
MDNSIKNILRENTQSNLLYHGGTEQIRELKPDAIQGGFRGIYGWGVYFSDYIYKAKDYGPVLTYMDKSKLNILDTREPVDETLVNSVKKLSSDESDVMLSAYYSIISNKLKEQLGKDIDTARKNISVDFRWDISKVWSETFQKLGYDAFKNGYEYVIFNYPKANQALISNPEALNENL